MKNETISGDGKTSEQTTKGAPGNNMKVPLGTYKIYSSLSYPNWLVDMSLSGGNQERNVKLFQDNNETESTWIFFNEENDYTYTIRNGKERDLYLSSIKADSVVAYNYGNSLSKSHRWSVRDAGNGFVYIVSAGELVLDVKQSITANNTDIITSGYAGTANQKFKLVRI
ncbi:RICIN domain-containing protein [Pseudomonas gingeri]|uniref:RICIN domain-containing protein n=1 Tax=Pseudomonas gingeri TaxID=117681 RepID=A0A7Y7WRA4_9PSED|nr:RICIN domain-containing protein [Pseudomonas gingeri]NWB85896.1 RICIN domain-containing protein [Pseudomonas gingeri]